MGEKEEAGPDHHDAEDLHREDALGVPADRTSGVHELLAETVGHTRRGEFAPRTADPTERWDQHPLIERRRELALANVRRREFDRSNRAEGFEHLPSLEDEILKRDEPQKHRSERQQHSDRYHVPSPTRRS